MFWKYYRARPIKSQRIHDVLQKTLLTFPVPEDNVTYHYDNLCAVSENNCLAAMTIHGRVIPTIPKGTAPVN